MASHPLLTAEAARARCTADAQRAAEAAQRYPGWHDAELTYGVTS